MVGQLIHYFQGTSCTEQFSVPHTVPALPDEMTGTQLPALKGFLPNGRGEHIYPSQWKALWEGSRRAKCSLSTGKRQTLSGWQKGKRRAGQKNLRVNPYGSCRGALRMVTPAHEQMQVVGGRGGLSNLHFWGKEIQV